jgi:hypothetical protein
MKSTQIIGLIGISENTAEDWVYCFRSLAAIYLFKQAHQRLEERVTLEIDESNIYKCKNHVGWL